MNIHGAGDGEFVSPAPIFWACTYNRVMNARGKWTIDTPGTFVISFAFEGVVL